MSEGLDAERVRADVPLLSDDPANAPVYLDNACVTLRPRPVIQAIAEYYTDFPACASRSVHRLSNEVTRRVDDARIDLARLVNAPAPERIVFTKNTTEAINHVAWGLPLARDDVVLTSDKEHNSNLVPWKQRERLEGIRHAWFPTDDWGAFDEEAYKAAVSEHRGKLRLVSVVHTSNLDGQTFPIETITEIAHDAGAAVLVDAAQSVPHRPVDVARLGVDYLAWSLHKMMGPSGMGCLYGTEDALRTLVPRVLGGQTVADSRLDGFELLDPPHVLEAGLQDYAGILGAGAAARYLMDLGPANVHEHEHRLGHHLTRRLEAVPGVQVHGPRDADDETRSDPALRGGIVPFTVEGLDSHDVALFLDESARVCIRSGAHCVHGWLNARGAPGWARASLYAYNTEAECDVLADQLQVLVRHMEAAG